VVARIQRILVGFSWPSRAATNTLQGEVGGLGKKRKLSEEDRAFLRSVGVKQGIPKPLSLWFVQAFLGIQVVAYVLRSLFGSGGFAAELSSAVVALPCLGLIVAIEKRRSWTHLVVSAGLAVTFLISLGNAYSGKRQGPYEIQPNEESGAAVGSITALILHAVLTLRVAFGEPARRYLLSPRSPRDSNG
jgi:hypothetical protein